MCNFQLILHISVCEKCSVEYRVETSPCSFPLSLDRGRDVCVGSGERGKPCKDGRLINGLKLPLSLSPYELKLTKS